MARPFVTVREFDMQASSSREGYRRDTGGYSRLQQVAGGDRWDTIGIQIQGDTQRERRTRIHEGYTGGYRGYRGHSRFQVATSRFQAAERCPSRGPRPRRSAMGYRRIQRFQATAGVTGGYNAVFVGDKRLQWVTEVTAARPLSPTGYKAGTSCSARLRCVHDALARAQLVTRCTEGV